MQPTLSRKTAAGCKYPIVDCAYNGASSAETPRNFPKAYLLGGRCGGSALTRLGFAMVFVDGRGTAMRSIAFRDAGYPEFTQVGIEHHVAAIEQLAVRHAELECPRWVFPDNRGVVRFRHRPF